MFYSKACSPVSFETAHPPSPLFFRISNSYVSNRDFPTVLKYLRFLGPSPYASYMYCLILSFLSFKLLKALFIVTISSLTSHSIFNILLLSPLLISQSDQWPIILKAMDWCFFSLYLVWFLCSIKLLNHPLFLLKFHDITLSRLLYTTLF